MALDGDHIVTRAQLAKILGKSEKTLQNWEKNEGLPVHEKSPGRGRPGKYNTIQVIDWLLQRELAKYGDVSSEGGLAVDPEVRLKALRGDKLAIEIDRLRGTVIPLRDAEAILADILSLAVSQFETLPSRAAARAAAESDPGMVRGLLRELVREIRPACFERLQSRLSEILDQVLEQGFENCAAGEFSTSSDAE